MDFLDWLNSKKPAYWIIGGCIVFLTIVILIAQAVRKVQRTAHRMSHANDMHQVLLSLANMDSAYGHLPPAIYKDKAGKPLCSWRFLILPYIQSWMGSPAMDFSQSWYSEANKFWASMRVRVFSWESFDGSPDQFDTNIVAITGPGTAFDDDHEISAEKIPGSTIILVEIAHSGIHYMAPGDLPLDRVSETLLKGGDGDGFCVGFPTDRPGSCRPMSHSQS
jgi:hypothetical protein